MPSARQTHNKLKAENSPNTQQNADRGKGCSDGTSRRRQTDDRPLPGRPTRCPQPGGSQRARGAAGPGEREGPEAGGRPAAGMREGLGPGSAPPPPLVPAPLPRASPGSGSLALHTGEGTETGAARTNRRGPARWRSGSASGLTDAAPPRASSRRLRRPARKDG